MEIISVTKNKIDVSVQETYYITGSGLLSDLNEIKPFKKDYCGFILISDELVYQKFGRIVLKSLGKLNKKIIDIQIPSGEKSKSFNQAKKIVDEALKKGVNRKFCLVTLGGGVSSDIGGFIGSILFRGISFIFIPTTLLSQVDASIGGKNGVDYQNENGLLFKNCIGTVVQPTAVICDTDLLKTLPEKEILNGLGEMIKYWVLWGKPDIKSLFKIKYPVNINNNLSGVIKECQKTKLKIISLDPLDNLHIREKLNLGHTIGHGIEAASHGELSHGQAVAIGLAAAARISVLLDFLPLKIYKNIISSIKSLGLPVTIKNIKKDEVLKALSVDKKTGTFVLIKDIGNVVCQVKVDPKIINKVLNEIII